MATKIYTKAGDEGVTGLIGGKRILKSDLRIESYGNVDELNSYLGLLGDYITDHDIKSNINRIQNQLFVIGSMLANEDSEQQVLSLPRLRIEEITWMEQEIDLLQSQLPQLTHFILPGGHTLVSCIHIARSVCRRTERSCVSLKANQLKVDSLILQYLNRLSDYLFVLARYTGKQLNIEEVIWKGK